MTAVPPGSRVRTGPLLFGFALLLWAAAIGLAPTLSGDNYCGRLYFDTQRHFACRDAMARRTVLFAWLIGSTDYRSERCAARNPPVIVRPWHRRT